MEEPEVDILATPIAQADFHMQPWGDRMQTRIRNSLQRAGIHTLGDLVVHDQSWLKDHAQGCGVVAIMVIGRKLKTVGLHLKKGQDNDR